MLEWLFTKTPLYFMTQSFWRDEAFSYYVGKQNIGTILRITAHDFTPPFHYVILHFWMMIFGTSEISLRSVSFLFYIATIYVAYLLLSQIYKIDGKRIYLYLLFLAFNPALLYFAFEARAYSLMYFLTTLSYYLFLRNKKKGYVVTILLGLFTHYYFIFVVLSQLFYSIFCKRTFFTKSKKIFLLLLLYIPWLLYSLPSLLSANSHFWIQKLTLSDSMKLPGYLFTAYDNYGGYTYYDTFIIPFSITLYLFIFLSFYLVKKKNSLFFLLGVWAFLFFTIIAITSFFKPLFLPRYLLFSSVGFIFYIIYVLEKTKPLFRYILLALFFFLTFHYIHYLSEGRHKGNIRSTIREIKTISSPSDLLYFNDAANYFVGVYYFDEKRVRIYGDMRSIRAYIGKAAIPENIITTKLPLYPQKAYLLNGDYQYTIETGL